MLIAGLAACGYDPAVVLNVDGNIRTLIEEERLVRIKHAPGLFPIRALARSLDFLGVGLLDVDVIAVNWDLPLFECGQATAFFDALNGRYHPTENTHRWQAMLRSRYRAQSLLDLWNAETFRYFHVDHRPCLVSFGHHECHAFYGLSQAPNGKHLIVSIDGSGDLDCTTIWEGQRSDDDVSLRLLDRRQIPHSLGWFYAAVTEFLGFRAYFDEYKVMALAATGQKSERIVAALEKVLWRTPDHFYEVDPSFIHNGTHSYSDRFCDSLAVLLGLLPRRRNEDITEIHRDIAFAAQHMVERIVLAIVDFFSVQHDLRSVVLVGGVANNVKLMNAVVDRCDVESVAIPPIPGDIGGLIGATMLAAKTRLNVMPPKLRSLFLGPSQATDIRHCLANCGIPFQVLADSPKEIAEILCTGALVARFTGRMEAGPRALGNRSILASPGTAAVAARLNAIKGREPWQPFASIIRAKDLGRYFVGAGKVADCSFMTGALTASEEFRTVAPAVVHVDGTARVQTVDSAVEPWMHKMLERLEEIGYHPIVLNTSFNLAGEPIVCELEQAVGAFYRSGLDYLLVENLLISKRGRVE